jgi:2-methylcitrate dehydratase PrpD
MNDSRNVSQIIARHCAEVSSSGIPASAIEGARRALLDAVGVSLSATTLAPDAAPYLALTAQASGPCRVIGTAISTDASHAAFANGALAHALDFGDCFDAGPAHPHAALVPVLFALADSHPGRTLDELLRALALGGDLACRLSLAPQRPFEDRGWYPPPLVNLIASAAAGAAFLGFDVERIVAAMSLALVSGAFPAALKYDRSSPLRGTREAFAARGAIEAVMLARQGAAGFADPLGGMGGLFDTYAGGFREGVLLADLGERFLGGEVSFKPWPACRGTQA